ncbi:MAG: hypothetical protein ACREQL_07925 [Candidatus Binatia bacterium]
MRQPVTPDGVRAVRLRRHEIDRIARAVAGGRRGLGARLDGFVDAIAARMTAKLAAAGVQTRGRTLRGSRVEMDRETRSLIVARVSKHLPTVDDAARDGSARSR